MMLKLFILKILLKCKVFFEEYHHSTNCIFIPSRLDVGSKDTSCVCATVAGRAESGESRIDASVLSNFRSVQAFALKARGPPHRQVQTMNLCTVMIMCL